MRAGEVFVFLLFCPFLPFGTYCILLVCLGLSGFLFLINILSTVFIHQKNKIKLFFV